MTDNTNLTADLRATVERFETTGATPSDLLLRDLTRAADALAARDAACGHLPNQLVAKALTVAAFCSLDEFFADQFTPDDVEALSAATFEVTGQ